MTLGAVTVFAQFALSITNTTSGKTMQGNASAKSYLDPSSFSKKLIETNGYLEWDPTLTEDFTFYSLWKI